MPVHGKCKVLKQQDYFRLCQQQDFCKNVTIIFVHLTPHNGALPSAAAVECELTRRRRYNKR